MFAMPDSCQPRAITRAIPPRPLPHGISHTALSTQLCGVSQSAGPLLWSVPNSGKADVVPFVASEKNVDACVVSIVCDQVYADCTESPPRNPRRTSTINALYQESPSLLFS